MSPCATCQAPPLGFSTGTGLRCPSIAPDDNRRRPGPHAAGRFSCPGCWGTGRPVRGRTMHTVTTTETDDMAVTQDPPTDPESAETIPILRDQIDAIDTAIAQLVAERVRLSRRIQTRAPEFGRHPGAARPRAGHPRPLPRRPGSGRSRSRRSGAAGISRRALSRLRPNHSMRRSAAQRVSWCRLDSCSLRSTFDACVSTVLIEMNNSAAISL